ncbi:MAG: ABC-F family ATP-binding cassette domain-containing protein [Erythrobacter sp.]
MPSILTLDRLCVRTPDRRPLFDDLSLSVGTERIGLVGRNGSGKSTLLNVIAGTQKPASGSVLCAGTVGVLAQEWSPDMDVSAALGVAEDLETLRRIAAGDGSTDDFANADWTLEKRIASALAETGLNEDALGRTMGSFSGGERTRIGIARLLIERPDLLLLDEPTNNLDQTGRDAVRSLIANWRGAVMVASHDRELLGAMDKIVEVTPIGVRIVTGGWQEFAELRDAERERAQAELERSGHALRQAEQTAQREKEKQQRRDKAGRAAAATGSQPAILLGKKAERAESSGASQGRIAKQRIGSAEAQLNEARAQVEVIKPITINLPKTGIVSVADILTIDGAVLDLGQRQFGPWSCKIRGSERIAICGQNGSGKTTFLKIASGSLKPDHATHCRATERTVMLDQHISILDPAASILDNFRRLNPELNQEGAYAACAHFAFRNRDTLQTVGTLSGGERLRAGLACTLAGARPPWLLILDEPTNHLDIETVELLENALATFDGALMVVSHDRRFLDAIGIHRFIDIGAISVATGKNSD